MTTTARDIVYGALGRLGVRNKRQSVPADMARDVLRSLNDLMHTFQTKGLSYAHTDLGLNDGFPLGDHHRKGMTAILAELISDDYAPEAVTPKLRRDVKDGWGALRGEFYVIPPSRFDLPRTC